ncbi:MAG TPA: FAD-dependent oxidoreductase [Vicinamibacterales bacterium]
MNSCARSVVIVGGGLSGLSAAVFMGRARIPAVLFDEAAKVGGRARTRCCHGFHLNLGPHRLYERGPAVTALRALGVPVEGAPRGPNGGFAVWRGRRFTLPVGLCSMLTTELFGPHAKREAARLLASLRAIDIAPLDRVSFLDWLRTRVDDPDVMQLVLAFVRSATYSDDADRLSASAALDQLRLSMSGAVLHLHQGWEALVTRLRLAATASGVTMSQGRVIAVNGDGTQATSVTLADGARVPSSAVVIATGPREAQRLLSDVAVIDDAAVPIRVSTLDVALRWLPQARTVFAIGIDEPWSFSADSSIADVAPRGGAVIQMAKCLRSGCTGQPNDERLLERALDLLQPGWRGAVVYRRFLADVIVSHALVVAETGGLRGRPNGRVRGLRNVFLAGDWIGPVGQLADASVASGIAAARSVERLAASR